MPEMKCGFCDGLIAYDPYTEKIDGMVMNFHAKA